MKLLPLLLLPLSLALLACGRPSEPPQAAAGSEDPAAPATPETPAATASSPDTPVIPTYVSSLNKVADAVEAVSDEDSARAAARAIAEAGRELAAITARFEQMGDFQKATVLIQGAASMIEPNTRISLAMSKIATEHPELIEVIAIEMDKLPILE
jgi:hypothetical protein